MTVDVNVVNNDDLKSFILKGLKFREPNISTGISILYILWIL